MSPSKAAVEAAEEILDALENPTPDMDDDLKGYLAEIIDRHARSAEAVSLIRQLTDEVENLQKKIAAGEQEGWEGSKRRCVLKAQARALLATLSNED